jgi:hypothetical protein
VRADASAAIRAGTQCQQRDYRGWDAGVMHGLLSAALAPVMADLRATGGPLPMVDDEDWVDDPEYASAMLRGPDGGGFGITVRLAAAECDRIASVADKVQEWAIEELWSRSATNWPPCPVHPDSHPLAALNRNGVARWVCPSDSTALAPIGSL